VYLVFMWLFMIYRSVLVASHLAYDILSGLSYMNSVGLVHRNLTPNNVLFDHQVLCSAVFPIVSDTGTLMDCC